jgi:hypothetical protein
LTAAKQKILNPVQRLDAELSGLPDIPFRRVAINTGCTRLPSLADQEKRILNLAPISRTNVIAHIGARRPIDAATLASWVTAQSIISLDAIERALNSFRDRAGGLKRLAIAPQLTKLGAS